MHEPVTLALVGCGWISDSHVRGYRDLHARGCRDFVVSACCDLNEAAAQRQADEIASFQGSRPRVFTDPRALADARVARAADVCVPHCFHHSTAIPLLESGMHVMLEKPLGITIRASKAIIAAAEAAKRVLATAENIRRNLAARACTWAIRDAKLIGDPVQGTVQIARDARIDIDDPKWRWRGVKALTGGGPLFDSGAHLTDMMLLTFGPVEKVWCQTRSTDGREVTALPLIGTARIDVEDCWNAVITFASGMRLSWSYTGAVKGADTRSGSYHGTAGSIADAGGWPLHPFQDGGTITRADGSTIAQARLERDFLLQLGAADKARMFPYGATDGFAIEVWDFIDAIASDRAPEMDGRAGLLAKTLCLCCYESATLGREVAFDEVLSGRIDAYQRPLDERWGLMAKAKAAS